MDRDITLIPGSETSTHLIQTPGLYPKENTLQDGFNCNMLGSRTNWDEYWENTVWSTEFWGGSCMVERVARCRTIINHKYIISFLLIFSFCLTYINYIMTCRNKCNSTVMYPMLSTHAVPLGSAPLLAPIPCTVMCCKPTIQSTTDCIYDSGPIRLCYYIIIPLCYNCLQYSSTVACCTGL
jgi:hypothetical protein